LADGGVTTYSGIVDVDLFVDCASGPAVPVTPGCCEDADFDEDGDADGNDFALLQRCFHAYGDAPDVSCLP
jgi:hypothetical protein